MSGLSCMGSMLKASMEDCNTVTVLEAREPGMKGGVCKGGD